MKKSVSYSNPEIVAKLFTRKDKDDSVLLYCIAGKIPNRNVIAAQIAANQGFELGKKYEVDVQEREAHELHGRQFNFVNLGEWTGSVSAARKEYGDPIVSDVAANPEFSSIGDQTKKQPELAGA